MDECKSVSKAATGRYKSGNQWQLDNISTVTINANVTARQQHITQQTVRLPIEPSSIYLLTRRPEDMSVA